MSRATRAAIWSRVKRFIAVLRSADSHHAAASAARPRFAVRRHFDHALDEDSRRDDRFGIEVAEVHDLAHLRDRAFRRARHDRAEVARGLAVDEVAPAVAALRP